MSIVWDTGTAIAGDGELTPAAPFVRVDLDVIPAYASHTEPAPFRYRQLGLVGASLAGSRLLGEPILWGEQLVAELPQDVDTIWYRLIAGVTGTLYRGVDMTASLALAARVYGTVAQTLATGAGTQVTFDAERLDPFGMHDTAGAPTRLTAKEAGWYMIGGSVVWAANATGRRALTVRLNGATPIGKSSLEASAANTTPWQSISTCWFLSTGDYVELIAEQTSGGNLDISASAANSPEFWATRVG